MYYSEDYFFAFLTSADTERQLQSCKVKCEHLVKFVQCNIYSTVFIIPHAVIDSNSIFVDSLFNL